MKKLTEAEDDEFLNEHQVFEEKLGSVDYDVWRCTSCKNNERLNYVNKFSKYRKCPHCGTAAMFTASRRTITSPTYTSTGTGEQTDRCKFCNKTVTTSYTIAKQTPPSSSGGGSGGGGGSSWGGGSSGGGGVSSKW